MGNLAEVGMKTNRTAASAWRAESTAVDPHLHQVGEIAAEPVRLVIASRPVDRPVTRRLDARSRFS